MQNVFLTFIMKQYIMQSLHSGALIKGGETKRKRLFGRRAWFTQNMSPCSALFYFKGTKPTYQIKIGIYVNFTERLFFSHYVHVLSSCMYFTIDYY